MNLFTLFFQDLSFNFNQEVYISYDQINYSHKSHTKQANGYIYLTNRTSFKYLEKFTSSILFKSENDVIFTTGKKIDSNFTHLIKEKYKNRILPTTLNSETYATPLPVQYYIENTGQQTGIPNEDLNITSVWKQNIYGNNIKITVTDNGCIPSDPSISKKYDEANSWNFAESCLTLAVSDPYCKEVQPNYSDEYFFHGTSCAHLAGGSMDSRCGPGIAPKSSISCMKLDEYLNTHNMKALISMLSKIRNVDVNTNSWGPACDLNKDLQTAFCPQSRRLEVYQKALEHTIETGRNGLGTIILFAAGNEGHLGDDTSFKILNCERYVIGVAASTNEGTRAFYSSRGNSILVNAPSGGRDFYSCSEEHLPGIYTTTGFKCMSNFSGTSAAAPQVAGIVALMLEANPKLSWRDVQAVLAITSTINDPTCPSWTKNKAGYYHSPYHGFGRANAGKAVNLAKNWKNLPNETTLKAERLNLEIYQCRSPAHDIYLTIEKDDINFIETVELEYELTSNAVGFLMIDVESPSGTKVNVKENSIQEDIEVKYTKFVLIRDFFGENATGDWKVSFKTTGCIPIVQLKSLRIIVHGMKKFYFRSLQKFGKKYHNFLPSRSKHFKIKERTIISECCKNITLHATYIDKEIYNKTIACLLIDEKGRRMSIGDINLTEKFDIKFPCIFQSKRFILALDLLEYKERVAISVKILPRKNVIEEGFVKPQKFDTIMTDSTENTTVDVKWQYFMDKVPRSLWGSSAILSIYDHDRKSILYTRRIFNTGEFNLTLSPKFSCPHCVLVLTPVHHSSDSTCTTFTQPVHIIKDDDDKPNDWNPFGFDPCEKRMIKRKSDMWLLDDVLLRPDFVFLMFFIGFVILIYKAALERNKYTRIKPKEFSDLEMLVKLESDSVEYEEQP